MVLPSNIRPECQPWRGRVCYLGHITFWINDSFDVYQNTTDIRLKHEYDWNTNEIRFGDNSWRIVEFLRVVKQSR